MNIIDRIVNEMISHRNRLGALPKRVHLGREEIGHANIGVHIRKVSGKRLILNLEVCEVDKQSCLEVG